MYQDLGQILVEICQMLNEQQSSEYLKQQMLKIPERLTGSSQSLQTSFSEELSSCMILAKDKILDSTKKQELT